MPSTGREAACRTLPFRAERNATIDTLRWARTRLHIPVLLEVDVTDLRHSVREVRRTSGAGLSLTAAIVGAVARAAARHPRVHSARRGRRIVLFEEVDVAVLAERPLPGADDETIPMPFVIRGAHAKEPTEIHDEIQRARSADVAAGAAAIHAGPSARLQAVFFRLPAPVRDALFWRWLFRSPMRMKRTMGTVAVTATGMVSPGILAWGIPASVHPLAVGIGGITQRRTPDGDRDVLALTVLFDHAVTDGAPVARFLGDLHGLLSRPQWLSS